MLTVSKLPIGISDFKELREDNYYFVDKTLFIREVWSNAGKILLFPRPRRFGKTLNLSMLRYFFEHTNNDQRWLFEPYAIAQDAEMMSHLGKYPVIHLTFKDVKESCFEDCLQKVSSRLCEEFELSQNLETVRTWYNGYRFGGRILYNPWSLIQYVDKGEDGPAPYWLNSSANELVRDLIVQGSLELRQQTDKEAGYGRYDLLLHPKRPDVPGYVIEFKKRNPRRESSVDATMQKALKQRQDQQYASPLREAGVSPIKGIGIVVEGKDVWVEWLDLQTNSI